MPELTYNNFLSQTNQLAFLALCDQALSAIFGWQAAREENENKFKERDLKINIESFANFFVVKKRVAKI